MKIVKSKKVKIVRSKIVKSSEIGIITRVVKWEQFDQRSIGQWESRRWLSAMRCSPQLLDPWGRDKSLEYSSQLAVVLGSLAGSIDAQHCLSYLDLLCEEDSFDTTESFNKKKKNYYYFT